MHEFPRPDPDWCLFLDFDGTLVELERRPEHVQASDRLITLLFDLSRALDGAVAIVSGRSVANLEGLLAPLRLPIAGIHGLERRDAHGLLHRYGEAVDGLEAVRAAVADFVDARPGLYWEDKGCALAVHYIDAPESGAEVERLLQQQRDRLGGHFHVQAGKAVYELKPAGRDKSAVVAEFLAEPPFAGRTPVVLGDDVTDEDAFAEVNRRDGWSIRVGAAGRTQARHCLASVGDALAWLEAIPVALDQRDPMELVSARRWQRPNGNGP